MSVHSGRRALAVLVVGSILLAGTAVAGTIASGGTLGTVFIQTAPALGGVRLLVGSSTVTTRPNGSAMVTVADINRIAARVSLASSVLDSRTKLSLAFVEAAPYTTKYQWTRVTDGVLVRTAAVTESHLTIGLDVSSKVTLRISAGTTGVARARSTLSACTPSPGRRCWSTRSERRRLACCRARQGLSPGWSLRR